MSRAAWDRANELHRRMRPAAVSLLVADAWREVGPRQSGLRRWCAEVYFWSGQLYGALVSGAEAVPPGDGSSDVLSPVEVFTSEAQMAEIVEDDELRAAVLAVMTIEGTTADVIVGACDRRRFH